MLTPTITAYTDGACRLSNPGLCCAGFIAYIDGKEVHRAARMLDGLNTNNVSEYTGVISCLEWAELMKFRGMTIYCDSLLVVNQSQARWKVSPELTKYAARVFQLLACGDHLLLHVKGHAGFTGNEAVDKFLNEKLDEHQGIPPKKEKTKRVGT